MTSRASEIVEFWKNVGPEGWYSQSDELDAQIVEKFHADWEIARKGGYKKWRQTPKGCLALLILLDQFPRNMFRGDGRSFATDKQALQIACSAINRKLDCLIKGPMKQFFYLPYMHSESLTDQERGVRLFLTRMPGDNLFHARAHRKVIRDFGRFPYRNAALGRDTTEREQAYLDAGGYMETKRQLEEMDKAA